MVGEDVNWFNHLWKMIWNFPQKKKKRKHHVKSVTQWTAARQIPLSMEFPRQQYWSGKPFPSPADLPDPGVEPVSPTLQVDSLLSKPPRKPHMIH